jgi:D-xylose reductase
LVQLTWAAMERLVELKLTRNLGVCSFPGALLMDLMTYAKIQPSVHQIEMHPYNSQEDQLALCKAFNIRCMAFTSFGPAR